MGPASAEEGKCVCVFVSWGGGGGGLIQYILVRYGAVKSLQM